MIKLIKPIIAILIFVVLFYKVPLNSLIQILSNASFELVVFFVAISFVLIFVSTLKWKIFIELKNEKISFFLLYKLYILGYFINLIFPSFIGGDAVRSYKLKDKVGIKVASIATFLERYTGFMAMLFLALVFVSFTNKISNEITLFIILLNLIAFFLSYLLFTNYIHFFLDKLSFLNKLNEKIKVIQIALKEAVSHKKELFISILLSFLFHALTVLNTLIAAYMLGWYNVSVLNLFLVLPIILTISAIPITPNGLGLQEGAFFVFLQSIGATSEVALGIALLLRIKSYFLALIGGVICLTMNSDE